MKSVRTSVGPFAEYDRFSDDEIERICSDELDRYGLLPKAPEAVRIDRFIENVNSGSKCNTAS